jgi:hypothetical protein
MKKFFLLMLVLLVTYLPLLSEQNENSVKILLKSKLRSFDQEELAKLQEILNNCENFNNSNKKLILVDALKEKAFAIDTMEFKGQEVPLEKADDLRKEWLLKELERLTQQNNELFQECSRCKDYMQDLNKLHLMFDGNGLLIDSQKMESRVSDVVVSPPDIGMIVLKPSESETRSADFTRLLLQESKECIQEIQKILGKK